MERITIDRLGHQGDGIAPGPIYAPGTLPGEVVEGVVNNGVMAAPSIVTPSETRIKPPCRHARSCGGCQLQHAREDFIADWKIDVVRRALEAQGLPCPIRGIVTSPAQSRRRASFSARRTKKGALAGFHQKGSDTVIAIPDCQLLRPALTAALPMVEALAGLGGSRKAELSVQVTDSQTGLDVHVRGGKPVDTALRSDLADLARDHDLACITWEDDSLARRPAFQQFGSAQVVPPPGAFLQATAEGEAALLEGVREALEGSKKVADLFSGCGTFALPLAQKAEVLAVEGDKAMVAALDKGWREAQGLKKVTAKARDLFRNPLLADELERLDGVVIDPPRAGAEAQVVQLARSKVARIAHVSCNPVTFARDTALLTAAGYRLMWVQVVDQFRWSTHVELVAELRFEG